MLETRRLGRSDLEITKVGIGTAPIGSTPNWRVYWGPQDEKTAIRAIQTALHAGVNWIDTAPFYGWGKAEEIVGKAVKDRREEVYIFTKCGTIPDGKGGSTENLKPDTIEREVEASLGRLQTDYIDLLQFHDADPTTPVEDSWRALQELVRVGKVRYGGLSNHTVDLIERALKVGPVTSNQVQYNPLQRKIEKDILPFSQRNSIGVLGWGSLAEGFLTDNFNVGKLDPKDFRRNHWYAQPENQAKVARVRDTLTRIARAHDRPMVDVVVAWELTHPAITGAIIGIRSEKEAKEMTGGTELLLTRDEMQEIDKASS
ncbi:aldo/keto reductase [Candidatus Bathyarchaeota archaeon]|nr:MAG: aldo/keto reductase [Candidatus Bathyarchaeota archaeon]TMI54110.1 MAG: aldo/keto reductase [Candidatus Bathyarchaeota archaeon]